MAGGAEREAWVVVDLGFGDAGKGTITDHLVRTRAATLVARYNGGAQAGHNVVTPDGRHHTFAQFGAGTLAPGVGTHLGPGFVLHPGGMRVEAEVLAGKGIGDAVERTTVDGRALVVTPFQQAAGRLREIARGPKAHGTCGVGIGEARGDALAGGDDTIRARDLRDVATLRRLLSRQQERKRAELRGGAIDDPRARSEHCLLDDPAAVDRVLEHWAPLRGRLRVLDEIESRQRLASARALVFEGAQGVLLDETWGFHPHTTWSDCTPRGALAMLAGLDARVIRLGVVRAWATRHGPGPFPTGEDAHTRAHPDPHNAGDGWQGPFRTGPFDGVLGRYALEVVGGVDGLAVTCLDRIAGPWRLAEGYEGGGMDGELAASDPSGSIVRRLVPGKERDLGHRQRLGEMLRTVRPVLGPASGEPAARIGEALGAAVWIESHGPTTRDKRWRAAAWPRRG